SGVYGCELVDLESIGEFDLVISVHWNKIIPIKYFNGKPAFNIHPCLDLYRGKNPVKKYIENKNRISSITSHYMIEEVDAGAEIYSETFFTGVVNTYQEFYDIALPFYFRVLNKTLEILK
ncbi:MAG TPA: formyltransferase family protein, partial [Ignavibacteriaceae bacterium]